MNFRDKKYKPGPELDAIIAKKIMRWTFLEKYEQTSLSGKKFIGEGWLDFDNEFWEKPHNYSTDIDDAWDLVEELCPKKDEFRLARFNMGEWRCTFAYFNGLESSAETAPMAICLAALETLESR